MASPTAYHLVLVESFCPASTSGRHGKTHIRPIAGQPLFPQQLYVQCSRTLINNYPVGTKFRIRAKLSLMQGTPYISSYHKWPYELVE